MFNQEYFTPGRTNLHRYEHDLAPMMATQLQRKLAVTASTSIHSSVKLSPSTLSVWCRSLWEMVIITGADYSEKWLWRGDGDGAIMMMITWRTTTIMAPQVPGILWLTATTTSTTHASLIMITMIIIVVIQDDYDAEYVADGSGAVDFAVGGFGDAEAEASDELHIYLLLTRSFTPSSRPILSSWVRHWC